MPAENTMHNVINPRNFHQRALSRSACKEVVTTLPMDSGEHSDRHNTEVLISKFCSLLWKDFKHSIEIVVHTALTARDCHTAADSTLSTSCSLALPLSGLVTRADSG